MLTITVTPYQPQNHYKGSASREYDVITSDYTFAEYHIVRLESNNGTTLIGAYYSAVEAFEAALSHRALLESTGLVVDLAVIKSKNDG